MCFRGVTSCLCCVFQGSNILSRDDLLELNITDPDHQRCILDAARQLPVPDVIGQLQSGDSIWPPNCSRKRCFSFTCRKSCFSFLDCVTLNTGTGVSCIGGFCWSRRSAGVVPLRSAGVVPRRLARLTPTSRLLQTLPESRRDDEGKTESVFATDDETGQ